MADFERAYAEKQVIVHQRLLDLLDKDLLANARDPFLKELLQEYRVMIEEHLDAARSLQGTAQPL
jgi:predicted outer membrane protein